MNKIRFAFSVLLLGSALAMGRAETFTLTPQSSNGQVMSTGGSYTAASVRVGLTSTSPYGCATVFVFGMPKAAFGDEITSASFSVYLKTIVGTGYTFNADLYGLGCAATTSISSADYFNGTYGTDSNAVPLQQQFLTPSSAVGRIIANSTGSTALAADLQRQAALGATQGSFYFLRLNPDFAAPWNNILGWNVSLLQDTTSNQPILTVTTSTPAQKGRVLIEYWTGITGSTISTLASSPNYPAKPSAREFSSTMEIPVSLDVNFGARLRGYFYPPVTGTYTFAVASDDASVLLLSTDSNPAHAAAVAQVSGWTNYQEWTKYTSQVSAPVSLVAGQPCYIEGLYKQGLAGSNFSIGYIPPGTSSITLMPTTNVAPYDPGLNFTDSTTLQAGLTQGHPRLILSPAAIKRLSTAIGVAGSTQATWWSAIKTKCDNTYLPASVLVPAAGANFISPARDLQDRVYYLALYYNLTTDSTVKANCLNRIYAELQSAANWGHSATDNTTAPGNWAQWQFLDVPEISHAFAIAYDWCYNGWTSTQRTFLVNTIATNALAPGITSYGPPQMWYYTDGTNWPIVCQSGLIFSALAILGDETSTPQAPTLLNDLVPALFTNSSMGKWAPDGGWEEAPTYGIFAMRYVTTLLSCLETSTGTCYNFDKLSGVSSAAAARVYLIGPTNRTFNYGDEYGDAIEKFPADQYLSLKYNQPVYAWRQLQNVQPYPLDLIWYDPRGTTATPWSLNLPTSTYLRNAGLIFLRSAWNDPNALFAGMKAGRNNCGHSNIEIGSFVFDALGVRWAQDMGRESYSVPGYFDTNPWDSPDRWQYYRTRAEGNNTLVINPGPDAGQSVTGTASITNFMSNATKQFAVIDMTPAYSQNSGTPYNKVVTTTAVTSAKRGMRFINGTAQIQDEITASTGVQVNWFMHTPATVTLSPDGKTATLTPTSGTSRLQMTIQSPSTAVFTTMNAVPLPTSPYPAGQTANTGITKLWIQLPSVTSTTLTVGMSPYIQGNTPPTPPSVTALSNW